MRRGWVLWWPVSDDSTESHDVCASALQCLPLPAPKSLFIFLHVASACCGHHVNETRASRFRFTAVPMFVTGPTTMAFGGAHFALSCVLRAADLSSGVCNFGF